MPIRFRCVYCEKLLGIARRKAGAVVNCPHCGEKLIVPTPEEGAEAPGTQDEGTRGTEEEQALAPAGGPQLFERSDFEALLQSEPTFRSGDDESGPPKSAKPKPPPPQFDLESDFPEKKPAPPLPALEKPPAVEPGVYLSPKWLTWLSVAGVLLLALAFALGLVVGRMTK
jgi:DNA-directed RNA polymerase subunit RPC12/RpoP